MPLSLGSSSYIYTTLPEVWWRSPESGASCFAAENASIPSSASIAKLTGKSANLDMVACAIAASLGRITHA